MVNAKLFSRIGGLLFQSILPHFFWKRELDQHLQTGRLKYECDVRSGRLEDVSGGRGTLDEQFSMRLPPDYATSSSFLGTRNTAWVKRRGDA